MENKVIEIINTLCEKVGMTINWGSENVMPYIQELITKCSKYFLISDSFVVGTSLLIAIVCVVVVISIFKKIIKECDCDDFVACMLLISGFIFVTSIVVFFLNIDHLIQDLTFPEIRIINYINDMN